MVFNLKYKIVEPADAETRTIKRFAWLPVIIGTQKIWLSKFWVLQVYVINKYVVVLKKKTDTEPEVKKLFPVGNWVDLSKAVIE